MSDTDQFEPASKVNPGVSRCISHWIQIQIPPKYTQDPIISTLVRYEVEVNIQSALLANNSQESGWFDLELRGTPERIQQVLDYLTSLHVEIWSSNTAAAESWGYR